MLLFVLVTCWYNPTFYSTSAKKITANRCTFGKILLFLYRLSGYLLGLIQLIVVFWYFYDCGSVNLNVTLNSLMQNNHAAVNLTNATNATNGTKYSTTFDTPTHHYNEFGAICYESSFANNVTFGQVTFFRDTPSQRDIGGYKREYSFWQDLILLIAVLAGILHCIPATGYLFYSAPIAFCAAHFGCMWCVLLVTTQFEQFQIWQYFLFASEQYIIEITLSATCIIFMVAFAIFLAISGMS